MPPPQAPTDPKDAERVAAFVLSHTERKAGPRARQARRKVKLGGGELGPALRTFAETQVLAVPEDAVDGLFGMVQGTHRADVRLEVLAPAELLGLQGRGIRVVSLLDDEAETAPHEDALAFAVHDLCHLSKFQVDHAGQVGFFRTMHDACILQAFDFDEAFRKDVVAVVTDMNGSPVFLLAALKMRLKMAVRRRLAAEAGRAAPVGGPLTAAETAAFEPVQELLLDRCSLQGSVREAAREITARRQGMENAHVFLEEMEKRGREALANEGGG